MSLHLLLLNLQTTILNDPFFIRTLGDRLSEAKYVATVAFLPSQYDVASQAKRLNAAARCMSVYQQGLLTLRKLRQSGHQRISVQYVKT